MLNNESQAGTEVQQRTKSTSAERQAAITPNPMLAAALSVDEGNSLICQFEGYRNMKERCFPDADENETFVTGELNYDLSWDWLMPIVEKISDERIYVTIHTFACEIGYRNGGAIIKYIEAKPKIKSVWLAVIEFIKWYNNNSVVSKGSS